MEWLFILIGLYMLPAFVAMMRKVPHVGSITVINVFLGWTLLGWVVALAMAVRSVPTAAPTAEFAAPSSDRTLGEATSPRP